MTDKSNPIFNDQAQAVLDRHVGEAMQELEALGIRAVGAVIGAMHGGETIASYAVAEGVRARGGALADHLDVVHEIAVDVEKALRPGP